MISVLLLERAHLFDEIHLEGHTFDHTHKSVSKHRSTVMSNMSTYSSNLINLSFSAGKVQKHVEAYASSPRAESASFTHCNSRVSSLFVSCQSRESNVMVHSNIRCMVNRRPFRLCLLWLWIRSWSPKIFWYSLKC
jgi:hypothetical protein